MAERDALRHELAEHDVQEREEEVREEDGEDRRQPVLELLRERLLAEGTDTERRERDAELHRRDELRRVARDAQDRTGPLVALVVELDHPRPPRGDEPVLRRDEERVQQNQDGDADKFESECHAAPPEGARVLEGSSSTRRARSIGNPAVVLAAVGAGQDDEPLEGRERLRDREPALDRRETRAPSVARDLASRAQ